MDDYTINKSELKETIILGLSENGQTISEIEYERKRKILGDASQEKFRKLPIWHHKSEIDRYVEKKLNVQKEFVERPFPSRPDYGTFYMLIVHEITKLRNSRIITDWKQGSGIWRLTQYPIIENSFQESKKNVNNENKRTCKGICKKFRVKKPLSGSRYGSGQGRCQICDIWIDYQGAHNNNGTPATENSVGWFCNCCNYRIRQKPRNIIYKTKLREQIENKSQVKTENITQIDKEYSSQDKVDYNIKKIKERKQSQTINNNSTIFDTAFIEDIENHIRQIHSTIKQANFDIGKVESLEITKYFFKPFEDITFAEILFDVLTISEKINETPKTSSDYTFSGGIYGLHRFEMFVGEWEMIKKIPFLSLKNEIKDIFEFNKKFKVKEQIIESDEFNNQGWEKISEIIYEQTSQFRDEALRHELIEEFENCRSIYELSKKFNHISKKEIEQLLKIDDRLPENLKRLHHKGVFFKHNKGISLDIALYIADYLGWDKERIETDVFEKAAMMLSEKFMRCYEQMKNGKSEDGSIASKVIQSFRDYHNHVGIEIKGIVESIDDFDTVIDVPETGRSIYMKTGVLVDNNGEEHKFTLWGNQIRNISCGTEIQMTNAYLSNEQKSESSLNVASKKYIEIISG